MTRKRLYPDARRGGVRDGIRSGTSPRIEVNRIGMGRQVSAALATRVSRSRALANRTNALSAGDHGRAVVLLALGAGCIHERRSDWRHGMRQQLSGIRDSSRAG